MSASPEPFPLLLRVPGAHGTVEEHVLPLAEWRYCVSQVGQQWRVTIVGSSELVYAGPGPVEIQGSPAPF